MMNVKEQKRKRNTTSGSARSTGVEFGAGGVGVATHGAGEEEEGGVGKGYVGHAGVEGDETGFFDEFVGSGRGSCGAGSSEGCVTVEEVLDGEVDVCDIAASKNAV